MEEKQYSDETSLENFRNVQEYAGTTEETITYSLIELFPKSTSDRILEPSDLEKVVQYHSKRAKWI